MASLLALSRAELEEAKRRFRHRKWANVGTLVARAATLFALPPIAYLFAVIALIFQVVAWWCSFKGGRLHGIAEEARRRALLMDGLGGVQEPLDTVDIRQQFSKKAENRADEFEDPDYYASTQPPGLERLRDFLQESAFLSKHLYAAAARRSLVVSVFLFIAVLLIALVVVPLVPGNAQLLVARMLVVTLGFIIAYDELGCALAWQVAGAQAGAVDRRLENLSVTSVQPAVGIFGDYSVATATTPPIPTSIYKKHKDRLDKGWAERRQEVRNE